MCYFIIDNHRTTLHNMKHQGKFKLNGRITCRTWIFSVLIICIQQKHCSAGGRSYTESEITWGEKFYIMQICSDCLLSRSRWYWSLSILQSRYMCQQGDICSSLASSIPLGLAWGMKEWKILLFFENWLP